MKRYFFFISLIAILSACSSQELVYHFFEGPIFGTSFNIQYEYSQGQDLDEEIIEIMNEFNRSLSNYDTASVISRFNENDPEVQADKYFSNCFSRAQEISQATDGAFDLTVAPLVNAWGFGFTKKELVCPELIDSLLELTGYKKVDLKDGKLIKENPGIMLDVSAIAKGYGVDIVSEFLESKGIENFLVEIGGELRCKGLSPSDTLWKVGVDKPLESLLTREFEVVLTLTNTSMATSGNYRQYYELDGVIYSHTIDPRSGFPVRHSLLSATVLAEDCMTADAYATAFMVMGFEKSKELVGSDSDLEAFLIYSDKNGDLATWSSEGMADIL